MRVLVSSHLSLSSHLVMGDRRHKDTSLRAVDANGLGTQGCMLHLTKVRGGTDRWPGIVARTGHHGHHHTAQELEVGKADPQSCGWEGPLNSAVGVEAAAWIHQSVAEAVVHHTEQVGVKEVEAEDEDIEAEEELGSASQIS